MDKNSIIKGLQVGSMITGMRRTTKKEPIAFLYNGVQLPPLPEWDMEKYPHAVMLGTGYLWVTSEVPMVRYSSSSFPGAYEVYAVKDGAYVFTNSDDSAGNVSGLPFWSSVDIYNDPAIEDVGGTLYLAASDPIPVYE